jgi:hypothetical protein
MELGLLSESVAILIVVANVLDIRLSVYHSVDSARRLIFGGLALALFYAVAAKQLRSP